MWNNGSKSARTMIRYGGRKWLVKAYGSSLKISEIGTLCNMNGSWSIEAVPATAANTQAKSGTPPRYSSTLAELKGAGLLDMYNEDSQQRANLSSAIEGGGDVTKDAQRSGWSLFPRPR